MKTRIDYTIEDLRDYEQFIKAPTDEQLNWDRLRELRRICGHSLQGKMHWSQIRPQLSGWDDENFCPVTLPLTQNMLETTAEKLARLKGWLRCASTLQLPMGATLDQIFESVEGYSYGYWGNPKIPFWTSPQKVQRWAWAVWNRAKGILAPYGWKPSRESIKAAIISHKLRRVGRVALQVAASSMPRAFGGGLYCNAEAGGNAPSRLLSLRQSRPVLEKARGWLLLRRRWGHDRAVVSSIINLMLEEPEISLCDAEREVVELYFSSPTTPDEAGFVPGKAVCTNHGIETRRCWEWAEEGPSRLIVAKHYRADRLRPVWCVEFPQTGESFHWYGWREEAIKRALIAWRRQREVAKNVLGGNTQKTLLARVPGLKGPATLIIRRDDSIRAGNCELGTDRWLKYRGYKYAIPYSFVIDYVGNDNIARVIRAL